MVTGRNEKDFELIPHTADIQVRVYGKTLKEFFRNAVVGMFQAVGPKVTECRKEGERVVCMTLPHRREVTVEAPDLTALLVDFLSEALYLSDVNDEAYLDADIHEVTENKIKATLHGINVTGFEVVEIKAVTYHNLEVKQIDGIWTADVVLDI